MALKPPAAPAPLKAVAAKTSGTTWFTWDNWPYFLGIGLAVLLVVLLVVLIIRRRRRAARAGATSPTTTAPKLDARKAWRSFRARLPREYRDAMGLYQPYIVAGAAGCGKSALIDRCTDWRAQAARFHPSHTDDTLLQIYQGSDVLVQELSAVLLEDAGDEARRALGKLWRPLRRGKAPRYVIVLDATQLPLLGPDGLVKQAHLHRGKINILSGILGRPVETQVVLTHAEAYGGFNELERLLASGGRGVSIPLDPTITQVEGLDGSFQRYEDLLPAALKEQSPEDYLRIIEFLEREEELARPVATFLGALQAPEPTSPRPALNALYLTSHEDSAPQADNPLLGLISDEDVARHSPLRRHRVAAATVVALGALYMGASYLYEASVIAGANDLLEPLTRSEQTLYQPVARKRFMNYMSQQKRSIWPMLLFDYSPDHPRFHKMRIYRRYLWAIRREVLFPRLIDAVKREETSTQALQHLALLYGTRKNGLGRMILADVPKWSYTLSIPSALIRDYLAYNSGKRFDVPVDLDAFDRVLGKAPRLDFQSASVFFSKLKEAQNQGHVSADGLSALVERATALLRASKGIDRRRRKLELLKALQVDANINLAKRWRKQVGTPPTIDESSMKKLIVALRKDSLAKPQFRGQALGGLLRELDSLVSARDTLGYRLSFRVQARTYRFESARWRQLLKTSRARQLLEAFMTQRARAHRDVLFPTRAQYDALAVAAGGFFRADGRVDGLYTREAYKDHVEPALKKLPALLKKLPLKKETKQRFEGFIARELNDYADRYIDEHRNYYRSIRYSIDSVPSLQNGLRQLSLASSPLRALLEEIDENTNLEFPKKNIHFAPLTKIPASFAFLQKLVRKGKGGAAAIDGYEAILADVVRALASDAATPAKDKDPAAALAAQLQPAGRVSLAIYLDRNTSPMKQVEAWLAGAGVRAGWRAPFVGPVAAAHSLGLKELNAELLASWRKLYDHYVAPLRRGFPLQPLANQELDALALEAALQPGKGFWSSFAGTFSAVLVDVRGRYLPRASRYRRPRLPYRMLTTVNAMRKLASTLWTKEGKARPLVIRVKALPLPTRKKGPDQPILAYLQLGKKTLFGFNQRPQWTPIQIAWWKPATATLGVAYGRRGSKKRIYRQLSAEESAWSFYRLLDKAELSGRSQNLWAFLLAAPGGGSARIRFRTADNPWRPFRALQKALSKKVKR